MMEKNGSDMGEGKRNLHAVFETFLRTGLLGD